MNRKGRPRTLTDTERKEHHKRNSRRYYYLHTREVLRRAKKKRLRSNTLMPLEEFMLVFSQEELIKDKISNIILT